MNYMKKVFITVSFCAIAFINGCTSLTAVDTMSNEELDKLVHDNVMKMVAQPKARRLLNSSRRIKIELLNLRNNTRSYMNREWDAIKSNLEEVFMNYENVEFYNLDDRRTGQKSINELASEGLIKAEQQKLAGEQEGADYNIQVTINETQINSSRKQYRMMVRWYERESQRPVASASVYFTK